MNRYAVIATVNKSQDSLKMITTETKITLEAKSLSIFFLLFKHNNYRGQRLGQAFFNHFALHKMRDQEQFAKLYEERDELKASSMIHSLVILS